MSSPIPLKIDEIDDIIYFTRANELTELQTTLTQLSQTYSLSTSAILTHSIDAETGNTTLHYSAANGLLPVLQFLLTTLQSSPIDTTTDIPAFVNKQNAQGNTPLHWAAYNGHLDVVKLLIASGADMWVKNSAGHLAMFEAERAEKSEVVQFLLEAGGREVEKGGVERPLEKSEEEEVAGESVEAGEGSSKDVEMVGTDGQV